MFMLSELTHERLKELCLRGFQLERRCRHRFVVGGGREPARFTADELCALAEDLWKLGLDAKRAAREIEGKHDLHGRRLGHGREEAEGAG